MEWHAPSLANVSSNLSATMRRTGFGWATFFIDNHKTFRLVAI